MEYFYAVLCIIFSFIIFILIKDYLRQQAWLKPALIFLISMGAITALIVSSHITFGALLFGLFIVFVL